jgi:23S rRNA pseudouridine955/2504/2580 synthase
MILRVCSEWRNSRLDRFLLHSFPSVSFALLSKLVRKRSIRLKTADSRASRISSLLQEGDCVVVNSAFLRERLMTPTAAVPSGDVLSGLDIVFEDASFAVAHKPPGMPCQPGGAQQRYNIADMVRPLGWRLPHRLDADASGAIVLCKTRLATVAFSKILKDKSNGIDYNRLRKIYIAVLDGIPKTRKGMSVFTH